MSSKADVTQANLDVEETRKSLITFWEKALDEDGNFDWVFGDPAKTFFAVRVWVGYDEEENVKVDIIYPASEDAIVDGNDGPTDEDLRVLEMLAYENASLLDKDVSAFSNILSSQMHGISGHESFIDKLWTDWQSAKQLSLQVTASWKLTAAMVTKSAQKTKNVKVARTADEEAEKNLRRYYLMQQEYVRQARERMQKEAEAKRTTKQLDQIRQMNAAEQKINAHGYKLFDGLFMPSESQGGFLDYLKRVFALESPFLLWSKSELRSVNPIVSRLTWIQEVNLSENALVGLPQELVSLPLLKRLFLHSNKLRVLPSFGGIPQLEILDLHNNDITLLPTDLGLLTNLQVIDMERNKLRVLPSEIGDLVKLNHLNLARNNIKIVPSTLVQLQNLTFLNLKLNPIVNLPPHIYVQGTAACMTYLREQTTDASQVQPSSIVADFTTLFRERKGFLADMIIRSSSKDAASISFPVHRAFISSRCNVISNTLYNIQQRGVSLPNDSQTGLPILDMDITAEQLSVLVSYLYTDGYTKPDLALLTVATHMTADEIVEIVKQNQLTTMNFTAALTRASETASTFRLPHLQCLVDTHRRPTEPVASSFVSDVKALYDNLVVGSSIASDLAGLDIPKPSSSEPSISAASVPAATPSKMGGAAQMVPCDVSFNFPAHPSVAPIDAHKAILCARSKFFSSLLTGGLIESQQRVVQINNIEPTVFKSIVEFCYTDDVYELSGDTIMDLLAAARLYGLDRLLGIVESVVGYSLDIDNVSSILSLSILYSLARLGRACKFFILSNWDNVTRSPGWAEVDADIRIKFLATARNWGVVQV